MIRWTSETILDFDRKSFYEYWIVFGTSTRMKVSTRMLKWVAALGPHVEYGTFILFITCGVDGLDLERER